MFIFVLQNFSRDLLSTQNKLSTSQKKYKELADEVSHIPAMIKNIQDITGQIGESFIQFLLSC